MSAELDTHTNIKSDTSTDIWRFKIRYISQWFFFSDTQNLNRFPKDLLWVVIYESLLHRYDYSVLK